MYSPVGFLLYDIQAIFYVNTGSFSDANSLLIFSCGAIPAQDGCEMNTQQLKN